MKNFAEIFFVYNLQIKITEVCIKKPFLKIFAQNIEDQDYKTLQCIHHAYKALKVGRVELGDLCMVKAEGEVYRCRVIDITNNQQAMLDFIDCGFIASLPLNSLRSIPTNNFFYNFPPICKEVYIAGTIIDTGVPHYRDKIKVPIFSALKNVIAELTVSCKVITEICCNINLLIIYLSTVRSNNTGRNQDKRFLFPKYRYGGSRLRRGS